MKLKIGDNIRKYRHELNITQQKFAEKLGVSFQSVVVGRTMKLIRIWSSCRQSRIFLK